MRVFREFLTRSINNDGKEAVDAANVVSRECYDLWVSTRKVLPPNPEKAFQRALSAHITGVDGRVAFTPAEEEAILKVLRKKERWPCFVNSSTRFGLMGFRAKGFHEKAAETGVTTEVNNVKRHRLSTAEDDSDLDGENEEEEEEETRHKLNVLNVPSIPSSGVIPKLNFTGAVKPTSIPEMVNFQFGAPHLSLLSAAAAAVNVNSAIPDPVPSASTWTIMPTFLNRSVGTSLSPDAQSSSVFGSEHSFLDIARMLLDQIYSSGVDAWGTILSLGRMILLSKGYVAPNVEDANRILKEYMEVYPSEHVLIMDITAKKLKDRVLAMSPSLDQIIGPVTRDKEGLQQRLVPIKDAFAALSAAVSAYRSPGTQVCEKLHIVTLKGQLLSLVHFNWYDKERLLVMRAVQIEE